MANRYQYSNTLTTKNTKKKYLSSVIYPKIKPSNNDLYIISEGGDRLDILASKYYGDKTLWWIIATANNLNDASLSITPGTQMRIPTNLSNILSDLEKINK
jgi:nucleoid-associated protein YgaU